MKGGVIWFSAECIDLFMFSWGERVCWPLSRQKCWGSGCIAQWKCRCRGLGSRWLWGQLAVSGMTVSDSKNHKHWGFVNQPDGNWDLSATFFFLYKLCWCCPLVGFMKYCNRNLQTDGNWNGQQSPYETTFTSSVSRVLFGSTLIYTHS